ncbi:MAG: hypothetical protein HGA97_05195 [Chlorobiaceae bacterium]|nr:hypothetical protein [Chlorobiaceae bacterium]
MSRSQIACAFSADSTTIARVKSTGTASCTMTMCRTIDGGLDALGGSKGLKHARKLVSLLRQWRDEPVALTYSPEEILTLPAWFPPDTPAERSERFCRIEAEYFLKEVDAWHWHAMAMESESGETNALERQMLMFYPASPAKLVEHELRQHYPVSTYGVHFEAVARLSAGSGAILPVLELEKRYTAFYRSSKGKIGYFRYWPVRKEDDRDYFAITELTSSPAGNTPVMVTGSEAAPNTLERISRATSFELKPLELQPWVSEAKGSGRGKSMTATIRAVSTAIMALNRES